MTVFVRRDGDVVDVRCVINTPEMSGDGHRRLKPDEELFNKPAGEIADGVYTDDGAYIGSHGEWLLNLRAD